PTRAEWPSVSVAPRWSIRRDDPEGLVPYTLGARGDRPVRAYLITDRHRGSIARPDYCLQCWEHRRDPGGRHDIHVGSGQLRRRAVYLLFWNRPRPDDGVAQTDPERADVSYLVPDLRSVRACPECRDVRSRGLADA